ncbi:MAG: hypothetical protein GX786_02500 [Clostridiales bacterium]|nr:hypothetical protein [Clostridiales bacterium]
MKKEKTFWASLIELIGGILFVVLGIIAFSNPGASLLAFVILYGVGAIVLGIGSIVRFIVLEKRTGFASASPLLLGILDIAAGIIILFNQPLGVLVLVWLFPLWLVLHSLLGLFSASLTRVYGKGYYWTNIIVNILTIIAGIMLAAQPISSALTLSVLFATGLTVLGIQSIVSAIRCFLQKK